MTNPTAKLDAVLNWLANNANNFWEIIEIVKTDSYKPLLKEINIQLLHIILHKLVKDGYCSLDAFPKTVRVGNDFKEDAVSYCYKITFEGLLFQEQGGYARQEALERIAIENNKQEEANRRSERKHQVNLTEALKRYQLWVVVGTIVAALYYLIEVLKYFHVLPSQLIYH